MAGTQEKKKTIEWEKLRVEREVIGRKAGKKKEKEMLSGVAEVILAGNKMNTMNGVFFRQIYDVFQVLDADPSVRCILLWSDRRVFSAGLDLQEASSTFTTSSDQTKATDDDDDEEEEEERETHEKTTTDRARELYHVVKEWQKYISEIRECKKPVIVACHSSVIGGAIDLITAADIRLCTEDATFSIAETKIGIVADLGTLQRITPIVGPGVAREMAFTGQAIDAARALAVKLVNQVYPDFSSLLIGARAMANQIAGLSPRAVQGTKIVLNYADQHPFSDSLNQVALFNSCFLDQDDVAEAIAAFMEKRPPNYRPLSRL